ncbi:DUF6125 family protein [Chloroflexota bacterium]
MAGLTDYSGEFNPKARYQDFSAETLATLLTEYTRIEIAHGGWWYDAVRERHGEEEAVECEKEVWKKGIPYIPLCITRALDIHGNDVAACIKTLQMAPGGCADIFDIDWGLEDASQGTCTTNRCPAMEFFESHGETVKMENMCQMEIDNVNMIANYFQSAYEDRTFETAASYERG